MCFLLLSSYFHIYVNLCKKKVLTSMSAEMRKTKWKVTTLFFLWIYFWTTFFANTLFMRKRNELKINWSLLVPLPSTMETLKCLYQEKAGKKRWVWLNRVRTSGALIRKQQNCRNMFECIYAKKNRRKIIIRLYLHFYLNYLNGNK